MKKLLSFILAIIAVTLPVIAQDSTGSSSTRRVGLEVRQTQESATTVHRAPMHINVEAFYNSDFNTLSIYYNGEAEGEVFLFLENSIIDYSSEINTVFPIITSGLYKVEIRTENWEAEGYIQL